MHHEIAMSNSKNKPQRSKPRAPSRLGSGPRLIIPPVTGRVPVDARLKTLVDDWLVPRLVDEFLREHQIREEPPEAEKPNLDFLN